MKPIFSIHAGEYLVGEYLESHFKNLRLWLPSKDTGIDILATDKNCKQNLSIQVKFSKDFYAGVERTEKNQKLKTGGWWTLQRDKIINSPADYWVMVLYQISGKKCDFIVIKPADLVKKYDQIFGEKNRISSYLTVTNHKTPRCWELRQLKNQDRTKIFQDTLTSPARNFDKYLNNWAAFEKLNNQ